MMCVTSLTPPPLMSWRSVIQWPLGLPRSMFNSRCSIWSAQVKEIVRRCCVLWFLCFMSCRFQWFIVTTGKAQVYRYGMDRDRSRREVLQNEALWRSCRTVRKRPTPPIHLAFGGSTAAKCGTPSHRRAVIDLDPWPKFRFLLSFFFIRPRRWSRHNDDVLRASCREASLTTELSALLNLY